jgi:hypothetical protein
MPFGQVPGLNMTAAHRPRRLLTPLKMLQRFPGAGRISLLPACPRNESHFQMEGVQAEDRHNPLPHIALSTTALKSAYSNTAFPSTHSPDELRKLLIAGRPGIVVSATALLRLRAWQDCVKCVTQKGSYSPG